MDPCLSLAFSMHARRGVYALLVGSGLSSAAGIKTGYQILLDLIRKVAALEGKDPGDELESWYSARFGEAPEYSRLIEGLARTPAGRSDLLRGYFEPTPEERERGLKRPTDAHKAIAR